jgi:tetratricopeptide (TPR) repeat protein
MRFYGLIIISFLLFQKVSAQTFEETIKFADHQYISGDLSSALKTYHRALFFSESEDNLYLFAQLAHISFLKTDYATATKYYGLAYNQAENDSLRTAFLFQKAACLMLNKDYQFAIIDLLSVDDSDTIIKKRLDFYLAICHFGLGDFENSKIYFESCIGIRHKKELEELFSEKKLWTPSPKAARIFSMIIPGSGQAYSGDLKSGLNSLILTTGLIALGINIGVNYHFIDAVATVLPWYQRYYMGGIGKAEEIAISRRQARRNKSYAEVLKLVDDSVK